MRRPIFRRPVESLAAAGATVGKLAQEQESQPVDKTSLRAAHFVEVAGRAFGQAHAKDFHDLDCTVTVPPSMMPTMGHDSLLAGSRLETSENSSFEPVPAVLVRPARFRAGGVGRLTAMTPPGSLITLTTDLAPIVRMSRR